MTPLPRRAFLQSTLAAVTTGLSAASSALTAAPAAAPAPSTSPTPATPLIDVNVSLGRWPFRHLAGDTPADLATRLRKNGVTAAWCGSYEALLHRDLAPVNRQVAEDCHTHGSGILIPVGSIHPLLPDWRHDLDLCVDEHGMKAIRLYPNYHGYTLDSSAFLDLLAEATARKLIIQIVAQMEDQRTQHPLVQVAPVDLKPLAAALKKYPAARIIVLNANRAMSMTALQGLPVWIDIAMLEGVAGVELLLKDWPLEKTVFGSHAPFFYLESARLKLQESDLTEGQLTAIAHSNAEKMA